MNKKHFMYLLCILFFCTNVLVIQAQVVFKGKVQDAKSGESLVGVSVVVKGTRIGTSTDFDGNFNIQASKNDVLQLSYVGYEDLEIKVLNFQGLKTIHMRADERFLNEVIVVGYGVQTKASSVGSITSTKGKDLLKSGVVTNISQALQGQMPGVVAVNATSKPGQDAADLFIRGKSTWGNSSPLVLVDGIERDFNDIDVQEVSSVSVLKDASATAVYGVKGANGVILLTTKRGLNSKPVVSLNMNFGFKKPTSSPDWSDYVTSMKQYNKAQANDKNWEGLIPESTITAWNNAYKTGNYGPYNDVFPEVDWWKETVKNLAYQQDYNVNIRGGTEKMQYFASIGYLNDGDIYKTQKQEEYDPSFSYKRYNWRSNFDFQITKTTKLSFNIAGKMGYQNQPAYRSGNTSTDDQWFFKWYFIAPSNTFPIKYSDGQWGDGVSEGENISIFLSNTGERNKKTYQGFYDIYLNQKLDFITKGLSAKLAVSYTSASTWNTNLIVGKAMDTNDLESLLTTIRYNRIYDYSNPITNADGSITYPLLSEVRHPGETAIGDMPLGGNYDSFTSYSRKLYYEFALNYKRTFGLHKVTGLFDFNRKKNEYCGGAFMNFPSYEEDWVGRITYSYKDRYLAEFNGAYTGSEKFAPDKRFGFFPSYSVGWHISEERWMKSLTKKFISNFKIRYSYGKVGNDKGAPRFNYIQTFNSGGKAQLGLNENNAWGPIYTEGNLADPNSTWEKSIKQNLGIDIGLWYKLNISLDLFKEQRTNILMYRQTVPAWLSSGAALPAVNLGETKNHGFEIEAKFNDDIGEFHYHVNFNLSSSENRIVFKDDPENLPDYLKAANKAIGYQTRYLAVGNFQTLDDIYNSPQSSISNGGQNTLIPGDLSYIDYNDDGVINNYDKVPVSELNYPTTTMGLTIGGNYKHFGFNIMLYGVTSVYKDAIGNYLWDFPAGNIKTQPNTLSSWSPNNPISNGPVRPSLHLVNNYNSLSSTYTYRNLAYIRLKNVELNYTLPSKLATKVGVKSCQFYVNGNNLLTFSHADSRRDPETAGQNVYPIVRLYNLGCRIKF